MEAGGATPKDGDHAGLEHQQKQRDDHQTGDAVGNFKKALHQHIHLAAEVARDEAIAHADDHIDDGGGHGDELVKLKVVLPKGPDPALEAFVSNWDRKGFNPREDGAP